MPRLVSYRIDDRQDGLFDAVATLAPDRTYRRAGFASLAEAEAWIDGLRALMAAIGAPVVRARSEPDFRAAPAFAIGDDAAAPNPDDARTRLRRFRDAMSAAEDATD